jgi:voltage-gated potassium channel
MPFVDALYFTLITSLTIGYGDIVPTTAAGRVLSILAGVVGVIFIGLIWSANSHFQTFNRSL